MLSILSFLVSPEVRDRIAISTRPAMSLSIRGHLDDLKEKKAKSAANSCLPKKNGQASLAWRTRVWVRKTLNGTEDVKRDRRR